MDYLDIIGIEEFSMREIGLHFNGNLCKANISSMQLHRLLLLYRLTYFSSSPK
jgi:hypothetical protein